mmetsp:Transcript_15524/g.33538  ORF Transcript_15524/g.33538 Transcript_15524/m.33538 type:complete len:352 (+) Transcript_15524:2458-3513(+)
MDVVQTYVPNNGGKDESFARRRNWDRDAKQFLRDRTQILSKAAAANTICLKKESSAAHKNSNNGISSSSSSSSSRNKGFDATVDRKLLWCGDMNATLSYRDGSHWERRKSSGSSNNNNRDKDDVDDKEVKLGGAVGDGGDSTVYEWFRDTKVCFSRSSNNAKNPPKLKENRGMPGFTPLERQRFAELLKEGDFCDLWREQHPKGVESVGGNDNDDDDDNDEKADESRWEHANYTWRGALSKTPGGFSKYQGRGQRIDYFLLSPSKFGVDAMATTRKRRQQLQQQQERVATGASSTTTTTTPAERENGDRCCHLEADCRIRGYGTRMEGLFCGSDHCAVELKLNYRNNGSRL